MTARPSIFRRIVSGSAVACLLLGSTACGQSDAPASQPSVQATSQAPATATVTRTSTATAAPNTAATSSVGDTPTSSSSATDDIYSSLVTYQGQGGLVLGSTGQELEKLDLVTPSDTCEKGWDVVNASREITLGFDGSGRLTGVLTTQKRAHTKEGARIGMTFGELEKLYGKGYLVRPMPIAEGLSIDVAQITDGEHAIYFGAVDEQGEWVDAKPSSKVAWIAVQPYANAMVFGC